MLHDEKVKSTGQQLKPICASHLRNIQFAWEKNHALAKSFGKVLLWKDTKEPVKPSDVGLPT